ncbi:hypothetical protein [Actinomyces naeslundii]|uniref:hypothetical protein n=1 Tax=Actinomyces naeslundii TaxID=1655 RepID=UPI0015BBB84E|nr:hypothetical protein [Actinomyces naeslundii]
MRCDSSPTVIASSFFFSCAVAVLLIVCALTALVCYLVRVGRECSTVLTTRLLTCCIRIHRPASITSVARAIACAWQDDPSLLIDQWVH